MSFALPEEFTRCNLPFIHHYDNLQTNVILLFYMNKVPQQSLDHGKWLLEAKDIHLIENAYSLAMDQRNGDF